MAVREGFLEEVIPKLTLERASENVRRCVWGGGEFQAEGTASTKVVQGAAGKLGGESSTSEE